MNFSIDFLTPILIVAGVVVASFMLLNTSKIWRHESEFRYTEILFVVGAIYILSYIALSNLPTFFYLDHVYENLYTYFYFAIAAIAIFTIIFSIVSISKKKAKEEQNFRERQQYRVFEDIDLLKTYSSRVGKKAQKWNMSGDEAKMIENFDSEALQDEVSGLKKIIKNDIGYPISISLNQVVKSNILRLKDDFIDVFGYALTTDKMRKIDRYIIKEIEEVHEIYEQLGDFDINEKILKFGSVEVAILDAIAEITKAKIPVNFSQLVAVAETDRDRDLLGAIQNVQNEKMVQRSGIYLYSYYLIRKRERA